MISNKHGRLPIFNGHYYSKGEFRFCKGMKAYFKSNNVGHMIETDVAEIDIAHKSMFIICEIPEYDKLTLKNKNIFKLLE